jgi:hypothetical protein
MDSIIVDPILVEPILVDSILVDSILVDSILVDSIIERFKRYRSSHPNLSNCWLAYLELKKRHYSDLDIAQGHRVLDCIENGYPDLSRNDMIRVLLYSNIQT